MDQDFISKRELAEMFGCTPQYIVYMVNKGTLLAPMRLGRQRTMLWRMSDLDTLQSQYESRNTIQGNPLLAKKP